MDFYLLKVTSSSILTRSKAKCPMCCCHLETVGRALWDCEAARDVWCKSYKAIQKLGFSSHSFLNILKKLSIKLDVLELVEAAMVFKLILMRRNKNIFEHPVCSCLRPKEKSVFFSKLKPTKQAPQPHTGAME